MFLQSFPIFLALADDNHNKTRVYALDALHALVCAAKTLDKIDADIINNVTRGMKLKIYNNFKTLMNNVKYLVTLDRLNDNPGNTRFKAIQLLKVTYKNPLPPDYLVHYEAHITQLYKTIVIFLDDEDIQQLILGNILYIDILTIRLNIFQHLCYNHSIIYITL